MSKILVMIPAGETYNHDCVRWYQALDINHYHNIGDAFVHDSSLKLLQYDTVDVMEISSAKPENIDRYNAEYDYVFLRGSNYIHPTMSWMQALPVLEKLRIPILAFGIGAQAPSRGPLTLSAETKRVLALIAERCTTVGVRGNFTADVLWSLGIKNTRIIGCPTLFRHNRPDLAIEIPPLAEVRRVGFSLRREVSDTYSPDVAHYLKVQRDTILDLASRYEVDVLAQGEVEEKKIVMGTAEQAEAAIAELTAQGWFVDANDPMLALYRNRMFYSDVVAEYDARVRQKDLVLGYRLHGNLIALANGVPSVYFTYDSRTAEFVETFKIPAYDVYSGREFRIEDFWDQALFDKFNRAYCHGYREMRQFLDENGVRHRMATTRPQLAELKAA